jgi:hypothetical protein
MVTDPIGTDRVGLRNWVAVIDDETAEDSVLWAI